MSDWLTAIRFARRDLRGGLKGFRIFLASLALGVAAIAGTSFGRFGEGYLRFSCASSIDNIEEAMARMKGWLAENTATR